MATISQSHAESTLRDRFLAFWTGLKFRSFTFRAHLLGAHLPGTALFHPRIFALKPVSNAYPTDLVANSIHSG